jgi:5-methylcytosine-specific restriction endonuclease McrA
VVDHVVPIVTLLALGRDPFDPAECQTLCASCSGRKSNVDDVRMRVR